MTVASSGCLPRRQRIRIAGGRLVIVPSDWEAQGVVQPREVELPPFWIDSHEVTEADWTSCVRAGRCTSVALSGEPGRALGGVTWSEAAEYCRWRQGELPSGDQLAWAAMGAEGRRYPWGNAGAVCRRAAFGLADGPCGWGATGPELAGSHPAGATAAGVHDLGGNVAEWTRPARGHAGAPSAGMPRRVAVHGGSWRDRTATDLRGWNARWLPPQSRSASIGFRCAYPANPKEATQP